MKKINAYPGIKSTVLLMMLMTAGSLQMRADEGMWIPMLIERYNILQMQEAGLKLSAEDIYSINQDCLKDAIVIFGRGCTGEVISDKGLVLTNHHCGEGAVQSHSSVENDYLSDGFWAMNRAEELSNENLSVTFLRYMKEVSAQVNEGLIQGMDPRERERKMELNMGKIMEEEVSGTHLEARIMPFYYGNAYYLFVYEVFRDVRLVGAPPVSVGNFGADQDNWMWPRHTGDFTLFRIYADENNQASEYDPSNRPYKPRKHLEISAQGIEEGDFTMVMGYPGSTTKYLYSEAVRHMLETNLPLNIELRTTRLNIMNRYMKESDLIRIQYATKYRRVSNAWKKWQGIILGLNRNKAVELKLEEEEEFRLWVAAQGERQMKYDRVLDEFARLYEEMEQYEVAVSMMNEAIMAVELFGQAPRIGEMMRQGMDKEMLVAQADRFFKDYHRPIDRDIFASMLEAYHREMPERFIPPFYDQIQRKYKGDYAGFAEDTYNKTVFGSREKMMKLFDKYEDNPEGALEQLGKDPVLDYLGQFRTLYLVGITPSYGELQDELEATYKIYMAALLEKEQDRLLFPDANFTMRLAYGKVDSYKPRDGVHYQYQTCLSGIMDKGREDFEDYRVPEKLTQLYESKDFGKYGVNGTMPVCFIASNHTSGGNSGSPVLDAHGRLIGINFDRNWEGTMSDVHYDPSLCRNIAVDIRYVLFIIDKFADASYLIDEMDISW
ncbi:MAG: S46 family peptidase [Bacteroidota bacterium]